ncbi:MAG: AraC family transcriptional regulator [Saprospiraceae bacterium]|nr:AraC family transcriptional regulator [Saprospiraceae bacterium]
MPINAWIILFTIAAAQGYFLVAVLFSKKENRIPNRLLALFLMCMSLTLTEWLLHWTKLIQQVPGFVAVSVSLPLAYGPILFLFYQTTFQTKQLPKRWWLHFMPMALMIIILLPIYLRFVYRVPALVQSTFTVLRHPLFPIIMFSLMSFYCIWIAMRFRSFLIGNNELQRWHRLILGAYIGVVLTYILYRLLPNLEIQAPVWKYIIALALTIFIYLIAWLGYAQHQVLQGMPLAKALQPQKYRKSSLSESESKQLFQQITYLMENEKLYIDSELNLDVLSQKLNKTRHHISQVINEQSDRNFADFINGYRIKAAQELLASSSKKEKNVIEIAYEVGFNTKKAFNLAFKKMTSMTPTEFRQSQEKKV